MKIAQKAVRIFPDDHPISTGACLSPQLYFDFPGGSEASGLHIASPQIYHVYAETRATVQHMEIAKLSWRKIHRNVLYVAFLSVLLFH